MSISQAVMGANEHRMIIERDDAVAELHRSREGVTVCIPTFNDAHYLQRSLLSVLRQTVPPFEVIIVDDGSDLQVHVPPEPDDYPHIPVRVVRVTNRGLPSARNTALMLCRSAAFLPLDADDWLDERYIEKTLPLLADADVVLTGLQEHGPTRNQSYSPGFDRHFSAVTVDLLLNDFNRFFYCSLFRADTLREIGGYHPAMAGWPGVNGGFEDWDMWIDLLSRGVRLAAVDEPLFNYTTRVDSMLSRAEQNRAALVAEMHRHHRIQAIAAPDGRRASSASRHGHLARDGAR